MTFNIGLLIPRLVFMIVATLTVVMMIKTFLAVNISVSEAEANILMTRLVYSPYCLSYVNPDTGRAMPGLVDINKLNKDRLERCVNYGENNDYVAAKITIDYMDGGQSEERIINEMGYKVWDPIAGREGPGGANYFVNSYYVLVIDRGKMRQAVLGIEVLNTNY